MEYIIRNKRSDKYLPRVDMWIMDDLHLTKTRDAMMYAMILTKKYFIWNTEFAGSILGCSGKTVWNTVDKLFKLGVIEKKVIEVAGRTRWILSPKYTVEGKVSQETLEEWQRLGEDKIRLVYADNYRYRKHK